MDPSLVIRPAQETDAEPIHAMICELAEFEQLADQVVSTPESIRNSLFGERSECEALVVDCDGEAVAFAIFFHNFSTFVGRPGLYLEDIYVRPSYRQKGIGKAVLIELAKIAEQRECKRFEWCVLDWNKNAIEFYKGLGASVLQDWRIVRLEADSIRRLAASSIAK